MKRFKVGDKVRLLPIKEAKERNNTYGRPGFNESMLPMFGKTVTIRETKGAYYKIEEDRELNAIRANGFSWCEKWMEPINVLPEELFEL